MQFSIKTPLCMQYFHERYNDIIMILKLKFIKKINQWNDQYQVSLSTPNAIDNFIKLYHHGYIPVHKFTGLAV